jgi:N-acetylmuramoyl-L-alanine amidase
VYKNIKWCPSPNFDERGEGVTIDMLVLHYTGMESGRAALDRLTAKNSQVSAHYFIEQNGTVSQLVADENRAWHAGVSAWKGNSNINARSIGIEIVNPGHEFGYTKFPEQQMSSVIELSKKIVGKYNILPTHVVGHSDIAPSRKEDPGELFSWDKLAAAGVGVWFDDECQLQKTRQPLRPGNKGDEVLNLQKMLIEIGYSVNLTGQFDDDLKVVVRAFQRHWRPSLIDGVADSETLSAVEAVFNKFGLLTLAMTKLN